MSETQSTDDQKTTWVRVMGVELVSASTDEVIAELELGPQHCQGFGIVHGGVYSGLIETVASWGAKEVTTSRGQPPPVGLENHTSFVRAARSGRIRAIATPITRGRTTQIWEATVRNEAGEVLATGRVRLLSVPPEHGGKA